MLEQFSLQRIVCVIVGHSSNYLNPFLLSKYSCKHSVIDHFYSSNNNILPVLYKHVFPSFPWGRQLCHEDAAEV